MVEEITEWKPAKRRYRFQLSEMEPIPLHEAYSAMSVEPTDNGQSMVIWDFYRVKFGPFGWLLGQTMMKTMMSKIFDGNLKGLADKVRSNWSATAQVT